MCLLASALAGEHSCPVLNDVSQTEEFAAVAEHFRQLHEPGFGLPYLLAEPHTTAAGGKIVVTGSVFDELVGTPRTALYTVEDGELAAVTAGSGSARYGRFSPDGRTLAFLSDRARPGVFQPYLLCGGRFGEATPVPELPGTVEYAHWSPDGERLLLGVAGLGADLSGAQGATANLTTQSDRPAWHPVVEDGSDESSWRVLYVFTLGTAEVTRISPEGMNCWEADWCGPSQVVAVTCDGPSENDWYSSVLTLLDVGTGEHRELLRSEVQLGWPTGSPDGRYASVVQAVCSDRWLVAGDVTLLDLSTGTRSTVDTAGTDVTWLQWIDANRLGYLGQRHLDSVAGIIEASTRTVAEVFATDASCAGARYPQGTFRADGRVLVTRHAYDLPPQLALLGEDQDEVLATLAHPGTDYLRSISGTAEPVTWTAPDGLEIEGIVYKPSGPGPFPLVLNVHGGPVFAYRNSWPLNPPYLALLVSRGYAVLNPNPRGSSGRGQEFAGAVVGDMGGDDTHDYLSGIDALVERGIADPDKIGVIGGSYGGFMSAWLVTQDQRFAAAVPTAPVTDWYSQSFTSNIGGWGNLFLRSDPEQPGTLAHTRSPVLQASKVRTPCFTIAGARDKCTPAGQAREFHQALLAHGHADSVLAVYPEEGHGVRSFPAIIDYVTRVLTWFDTHMPAEKK